MSKMLKKGVSAWLIFIKNKIVGAVMMFISGFMMALAGFNGNGNDVKTLPYAITTFGFAFSLWALYRIGYIKANYDKEDNDEKKAILKRNFILQIFESIMYIVITMVGVNLLINENFTNKILDLMCGCFTILNGVFGSIYIFNNLENKNFGWKFRIGLTLLEFIMGFYFIIASNSIDSTGYLIMGSMTTIAGIIEIIHAVNRENIENTVKDGKDIVKTLKG